MKFLDQASDRAMAAQVASLFAVRNTSPMAALMAEMAVKVATFGSLRPETSIPSSITAINNTSKPEQVPMAWDGTARVPAVQMLN